MSDYLGTVVVNKPDKHLPCDNYAIPTDNTDHFALSSGHKNVLFCLCVHSCACDTMQSMTTIIIIIIYYNILLLNGHLPHSC